jgi:seryl-tRNA synthetase
MGDPDFRQIDLETWMPGQDKYRETHTADLMTDYQARRLGTKLRRKDGSTELVHMNDATATAIGRMLIAIMENYQQKDGSIEIPQALQTYFGGKKL